MKKGFTLAEVLITLGIIGIVAALTIPNLIANYNAKAYDTRIKEAYSIIQNANGLIISEQIDPYNYYNNSIKGSAILDEQAKDYAKLMKGATLCDTTKSTKCRRTYTNLADQATQHIGPISNKISIILPNGMIMWFGFYHWIFIDINGFEKPNRTGYDLHVFKINEKNSILPVSAPAHDTRPCSFIGTNYSDSYLGYGCTEFALINKNPDGEGNYWRDFLKIK